MVEWGAGAFGGGKAALDRTTGPWEAPERRAQDGRERRGARTSLRRCIAAVCCCRTIATRAAMGWRGGCCAGWGWVMCSRGLLAGHPRPCAQKRRWTHASRAPRRNNLPSGPAAAWCPLLRAPLCPPSPPSPPSPMRRPTAAAASPASYSPAHAANSALPQGAFSATRRQKAPGVHLRSTPRLPRLRLASHIFPRRRGPEDPRVAFSLPLWSQARRTAPGTLGPAGLQSASHRHHHSLRMPVCTHMSPQRARNTDAPARFASSRPACLPSPSCNGPSPTCPNASQPANRETHATAHAPTFALPTSPALNHALCLRSRAHRAPPPPPFPMLSAILFQRLEKLQAH
jgi:hypothetical protein